MYPPWCALAHPASMKSIKFDLPSSSATFKKIDKKTKNKIYNTISAYMNVTEGRTMTFGHIKKKFAHYNVEKHNKKIYLTSCYQHIRLQNHTENKSILVS